MPADGGSAERVSFNGSYNVSPALSPDGRTWPT
jgi:TolB protein